MIGAFQLTVGLSLIFLGIANALIGTQTLLSKDWEIWPAQRTFTAFLIIPMRFESRFYWWRWVRVVQRKMPNWETVEVREL